MRDQAARLVSQLCSRFSDAYYNMQPRISRTLVKALLDKSKPLTTHYGAVEGLGLMVKPMTLCSPAFCETCSRHC